MTTFPKKQRSMKKCLKVVYDYFDKDALVVYRLSSYVRDSVTRVQILVFCNSFTAHPLEKNMNPSIRPPKG